VSRPCRWPDGGCGEPVEFFPTGKTKPDGKPVLQVVDATPERRIILEPTSYAGQAHQPLAPSGTRVARVVDTYVDHHATCTAWAAKVERGRAIIKEARP
jgi:hypothetical protein